MKIKTYKTTEIDNINAKLKKANFKIKSKKGMKNSELYEGIIKKFNGSLGVSIINKLKEKK